MKNSLRIHKWTHNEFNIFILGVLTHPHILICLEVDYFLLIARSIATAIATVAPTIGLLPIPRKPIIST